jgi:hypothetical protein
MRLRKLLPPRALSRSGGPARWLGAWASEGDRLQRAEASPTLHRLFVAYLRVRASNPATNWALAPPVSLRSLLPPRLLAAALLVLPLLWAQTLGLVHGISHGVAHGSARHDVHAPDQPHAHGHAHAHHDPHRAHEGPHAAALSGLFAHDVEDSAQCRLFDQVGMADAVLVAVWLAPQVPPGAELQLAVAQRSSHALAGLPQARAPPLTA